MTTAAGLREVSRPGTARRHGAVRQLHALRRPEEEDRALRPAYRGCGRDPGPGRCLDGSQHRRRRHHADASADGTVLCQAGYDSATRLSWSRRRT